MQQATTTSDMLDTPPPPRTPEERGRRIELLLWAAGLVLLCVAWALTFQVIATMRAGAISSMQFAELSTLRAVTSDLSRCIGEHASLLPAAAQDTARLTGHCLEPLTGIDEWQLWAMRVDALPLEPAPAGAAYNAALAPRQMLLDLFAAGAETAREGSSVYVRDPAAGAEVAAWLATELDGAPWLVGVAVPQQAVLNATGVPQQGQVLVGVMGLATLIGLLLLTVTANSMRRQHDAEQALTNANAALESRVAQRTAELLTANAEMQQEIERRLHLENALSASEERSRSLLNAIPDLMFVVDRAGNYLEVRGNPDSAHHQMVMTTAGENIAQSGLGAADLLRVHAAIAAALAQGSTQEVTFQTYTPAAGSHVWTVRLAAINQGEVLMLSRDITAYSNALAMIEQVNQEVLSAYDATLLGWSRMLEVRENEVAGHSQRVADLTVLLARRLGCSEAEITQIRRGALLHDIGKMALPDAILRKAGALTEEERHLVQQHPDLAYSWLSGIEFLRPALDIPYCHHERWNGSGYPRGLRGAEIPLAARIFSVVDVWDALLADRPYKARWTPSAAAAYLVEHAGVLFDPEVVTAFIDMLDGETL